MMKNEESNGTEGFDLLIPTPGYAMLGARDETVASFYTTAYSIQYVKLVCLIRNSQSLDTDMQRLFIQCGHHRSLPMLRVGERRRPQNKTSVVHRYQSTVENLLRHKDMLIDDLVSQAR